MLAAERVTDDGGCAQDGRVTDILEPRTEAPTCPRCGSRAVPILRGYPSPEGFAAAERGEVVLGGCVIAHDDPHFACVGVDCGLRFTPGDPATPRSQTA